jgi:hypothetical protein
MAAGADDNMPTIGPDDSDSEEMEDARIADVDNSVRKRRLKQLLEAKERVVDVRERVSGLSATRSSFSDEELNAFLANAVVAFIDELESLLSAKNEERGEQFRTEEFGVVEGESRTIAEFRDNRGQLEFAEDGETKSATAPQEASMAAFRVAHKHFDRLIVDNVFEEPSPSPEQNPIDPKGRFRDDG